MCAHPGLRAQPASCLGTCPRDVASQAIAEAAGQLDDTIRGIGNNAFVTCSREPIPHPETVPGDPALTP